MSSKYMNQTEILSVKSCDKKLSKMAGDSFFDARLYNIVMLGLSFMFIFTAFQTAGMVEVNHKIVVYMVLMMNIHFLATSVSKLWAGARKIENHQSTMVSCITLLNPYQTAVSVLDQTQSICR